MSVKYELQKIISGIGDSTKATSIQAVNNFIRNCKRSGSISEKEEHFKEQEAKALIEFASVNHLLVYTYPRNRFLAEGAEQRVYLNDNNSTVTKLNDSIFYRSWEDYFKNLLLHNYFFPSTSYLFHGFLIEEEKLFAVVEQPYIIATEPTNLQYVKELMHENGFKNTRNNDYLSESLGIILEDLHDENVLTKDGVPFFIDTVFYLTKEFYNS